MSAPQHSVHAVPFPSGPAATLDPKPCKRFGCVAPALTLA